MLTEVILEGEFAKVAGRKKWMLDCNSAAEAIQLISANCQGKLSTWIRQNLAQYKICQVDCQSEKGEKESLNNESFGMERKCKQIRFVPIFTGAGGDNGILQAVVGVAIVVVSCFVPAAWGTVGAAISSALTSVGVGMILGAIATMLMSPSKDDDEDDGRQSYYFNGAVNTVEQGNPVPLVFGRCRVGSAVISSSIEVKDQ